MSNDIFPVLVVSGAAGAMNTAGSDITTLYPFFASAAWILVGVISLAVVND